MDDYVRIVETPTFQKTAKDFLSEHELTGLRHVLANNPLAGKESKTFPGIFVLDWREDNTVLVTYLVSKTFDEVVLITIDSGKDDEERSTEIAQVLESLKKYGIGFGIKSLFDLISDWLKGL